jgi:hypothetical protein
MSVNRVLLLALALLSLLAVVPGLYAQTTTSGLVTGVVLDPSKAVVAGADVSLTEHGTNVEHKTVTDSSGRYLFPNVNPSDYTLRVSAKGFKTAEVGQVHVEVLKSATIDISLEIGAATQTVVVTEAPGAELQTTDASIGTVISGDMLLRLPSFQRSVTALIFLQPAVSPAGSQGDDVNGGEVAGALADQTTFFVDGGDATSDLEGTNSYVSPPGEPQPAPFIAVPAETVQEFRVVTANPTSSFARSQGGEVAILTKSGTNSLHGSAYDYYYGSGTSANDWLLNSIGRHRPHSVNNRFGGSLGGPIWKDKLFLYGNYEGRRFHQATTLTQLVPTDAVRAGNLVFRDGTGNPVTYSLNAGSISKSCGSSGTASCDPRNLGVSPLITNYMKLLPEPNNFSTGDGLDSAGFTASFSEPVIEDLGVVRADYNINSKWSMFATYHYNRYNLATTQQFDITAGTTPHLVSSTPVQPRFVTFMVTGQVSPHFTSQTHGSYLRDWWGWNRAALAPQVAGTAGTINLAGESKFGTTSSSGKVWGDPINFDTQDARTRLWAGKDYYAAEDATYLHGNHTIQFGGGYYLWNLVHQRTDIVTGGLTNGPIYYVGETTRNRGNFLSIPVSDSTTGGVTTIGEAPPKCPTATSGTNCLPSSGAQARWSNMYASLLGLMDRSAQIAVRDGNFIASPLGSQLIDHVRTHSFESYVQDSWKIKPSFTVTYGLSYGVQFAPHERDGKQVLQVFANNNQPLLNANAYFQQRDAALTSGGFFATGLTPQTDSTIGFSPILHIPGRTSSSPTQWNNFGPRIAVAWNVPFNNRIFGDHKTVIRGGYSILWNRTNAVGEVLVPLLGDGLASATGCNGPTFNGSTTATCSNGTINATNGFRLGVDGSTAPVPPAANASIPLVPTSPFSAKASLSDPGIRLPYSHNVSLDIQRAFSNNLLIDVGFIGRYARSVWENVDLNSPDLNAKSSGQTLAQAYNAVNAAVAAGTKPYLANGTTPNPAFPLQPFFENAPYGCTNCTNKIAASPGAGDPNLSTFMLNNYDFIAPHPLDPMQMLSGVFAGGDNMTTNGGIANYNALFTTVRKSMSQGLDFSFNYTWSHSLGTAGQSQLGQQYTSYSPPTPFNFFSGWGSNNGDRRHVINVSWYYLLPFGKGRHFANSSGALDKVIGGWYVSGIYTWSTGRPICIGADGNYGAPDAFTCAIGTSLYGQTSTNKGVFGSGGVGTVGDPANGGSGINIFANPAAAFNGLKMPLPGVDNRPNQDVLSEPRIWNVDLAFGKKLLVTERFALVFSAEMFNAFNHPLFGTDVNNSVVGSSVSLDLSDPAGFGVVSKADNKARIIQLGLRFEF